MITIAITYFQATAIAGAIIVIASCCCSLTHYAGYSVGVEAGIAAAKIAANKIEAEGFYKGATEAVLGLARKGVIAVYSDGTITGYESNKWSLYAVDFPGNEQRQD